MASRGMKLAYTRYRDASATVVNACWKMCHTLNEEAPVGIFFFVCAFREFQVELWGTSPRLHAIIAC